MAGSHKYKQITNVYPLLKHPEKYNGELPITSRSSWESKFILRYLDVNENILSWKSEVPIPYICGTDGRRHRYFVDFTFKAKTKDGSIKEFLIEIKPYKETQPVPIPTRKTASYYRQLNTYIKNQSKWNATRQIIEKANAAGHNSEFLIITEKDCSWFVSKK